MYLSLDISNNIDSFNWYETYLIEILIVISNIDSDSNSDSNSSISSISSISNLGKNIIVSYE